MESLLPDYKIGKTIGYGSFSKVKIAIHKSTNVQVAIKIIDKEVMRKAEARILENKRKHNLIEQHRIQIVDDYFSENDSNDKIPVTFSEIIARLMKKRQEINSITIPEVEISENKMDFISRFEVLIFNVEGNSVIDAAGSSQYHSNVSNHRVRKGNLSGDVMDAKIGTMPQGESSWTSSPQQVH
jgi:serine/threonine protein kinase